MKNLVKKFKKPKLWTTKRADVVFSKLIHERDKVCIRQSSSCGGNLECSHFFSRNFSGTRYDPLNCDLLCHVHHQNIYIGWEHKKNLDYQAWKRKQLGKKGYSKLEKRAMAVTPRSKAIEEFMRLMGK